MMREWWQEDLEFNTRRFETPDFNDENVKQERAYLHPRCHYYTIGDNWCSECGEHSSGHGARTFTIYFKPKPRPAQ
jgi:hypothetical protein